MTPIHTHNNNNSTYMNKSHTIKANTVEHKIFLIKTKQTNKFKPNQIGKYIENTLIKTNKNKSHINTHNINQTYIQQRTIQSTQYRIHTRQHIIKQSTIQQTHINKQLITLQTHQTTTTTQPKHKHAIKHKHINTQPTQQQTMIT